MKKVIILLTFLISTLSIKAATYYIAPSGSDGSGTGYISSPWFTLTKAWGYLNPGDILYCRGGTYNYTATNHLYGRSGTSYNSQIIISNYPGETPVFSYASLTNPSSQYIGIYLENADYIVLRGLRVTTIRQPTSGNIAQYGFVPENASHCIFEQLVMDHIGGWGCVFNNGCEDDLLLNCDFYDNADPYSGGGIGSPYGASDGIESAAGTSTTNITIDGCRFWGNSDDGLDLRRAQGYWEIKNTWSFHNGYREDQTTPGGNGEGFKCGGPDIPNPDVILRRVTNCLAFDNLSAGITPEPDIVDGIFLAFGMECYNCTAYHNGGGIGFSYDNLNIVRNVLSFNSTGYELYYWGARTTHSNNILSGGQGSGNSDIALTITSADFLSGGLDPTGTDGDRTASGGLPVLNFLKPSATSQLRNRGAATSVTGLTTDCAGVAYIANSPSIGAYEYNTGGGISPSVTTTSVTGITTTTASSGGNVTSEGSATVTARGVCWSTYINPTTSNNITTDGSGTGSFTSSITGLTANTVYHVRAYATNSVSTSYGADVQFTTSPGTSIPSVTTNSITNILVTTATGGGNVTSNGGSSLTAIGVCWSTTTNPTISGSHTSDGTSTGTFTSSLTGLIANTFYYVRAYATNSLGTAYGSNVTFTTLTTSVVELPTVTTTVITGILETSATGGGNVTADGGGTVTERGVCWDQSGGPALDNVHTHDGTGTGVFTSSITGLSPSTTYYVVAYATNSAGTSYGARVQFISAGGNSIPTVTTTAVSILTATTASGGGNIISNGGLTITARGVCWQGGSPNPTISGYHTSDGTGTGVFTSTLTNLVSGGNGYVYYARAYATNSVGTAYGDNYLFITLGTGGKVLMRHGKEYRKYGARGAGKIMTKR